MTNAVIVNKTFKLVEVTKDLVKGRLFVIICMEWLFPDVIGSVLKQLKAGINML